MFKDQDLVTIKPEWQEMHDKPEHIYLVLGDESDHGAVKITPTWDTGLRFPPINTVKAASLQLTKE
jgi:hypothetical protein